ncbi:hypothetical protein ISG33_04640 [Glaciecola sp. MH2013]|uniref:SGNH/GDSL hydrolase family protein n=1 Tax=Glaciecola sp. MH2013 TaxID=2785524 RepID=UPI00189DCCCF|nr:hypothetical protein [Glaciecola sp. MH2013]MBF7072685.1 hypothetical protein [Glaciecola sp. MH2013]
MKKAANQKVKSTIASSTSVKRKRLMYAIAFSLPLMFFIFVELVLRLAGVGQSYPLFIENPANPHYVLPRPDILNRYFPKNAEKPSVTMEANFILKEKPSSGFRVVVQGGSTAAGFPYGLGASIAGTLEQRLKASLPGVHVEVLNTAMSAVNSYTLLDMADEIIEQEPDLVLIYAGHNEYLGILGVGSNFTAMGSSTTTRWYMRLKELRLVQLLQAAAYSMGKMPAKPSASEITDDKSIQERENQRSRTFMAKVAKNRSIEYDSAVYHDGLAQFKSNLSRLLAKYQSAGIPVLISTIASNHKDQAPFSSIEAEPSFERSMSVILNEKNNDELKKTIRKATLTLEKSKSANLHFKIAKLAERVDLITIAKKHYQLAINNDLLRFRAPTAMNEIIRELADNYSATLIDAEKELEIRSKNGIIGQSLMLEHLHPNLRGYFVISNSFYEGIIQLFTQSRNPEHVFSSKFQKVSIAQAWAERLILPQEEYYGFATIQSLTSDYPFTNQAKTPSLPAPADWQQQLGQDFYLKKLGWLQMMELSLKRYTTSDNHKMRAKTLQILADALPHNGLYNLQIAEIKFKQGRYGESLHYYKRAKLAGAIGSAIDSNIAAINSLL